MEREAAAFLAALDDDQLAAATRRFDDADRRWIEYRPRPRPGLMLADLGLAARKAGARVATSAATSSPSTTRAELNLLARAW